MMTDPLNQIRIQELQRELREIRAEGDEILPVRNRLEGDTETMEAERTNLSRLIDEVPSLADAVRDCHLATSEAYFYGSRRHALEQHLETLARRIREMHGSYRSSIAQTYKVSLNRLDGVIAANRERIDAYNARLTVLTTRTEQIVSELGELNHRIG